MTYTLTAAGIQDLLTWYKKECRVSVVLNGAETVMELFFTDHPEHLTEQPSTSKRDEVLRVATAFALIGETIDNAVTLSMNLIAEVDKRFNTKEG